MDDKNKAFQFPGIYPLKVVGRNTLKFQAVVAAIIEKHVAEGVDVAYSTRVSSGDRYLSLTAIFPVQDHDQLTAIYGELNRHDLVLMII
jgi:uncharacterized protein